MKTTTKLGIWMDHAHAHLLDCTTLPIQTTTVASNFDHEAERITIERSEKGMHNKEQHLEADYYKRLGDHILKYDEVLLFGPTDAKVELFHVLRGDPRFIHINIETLPADKMTENQQRAFAREYFSYQGNGHEHQEND